MCPYLCPEGEVNEKTLSLRERVGLGACQCVRARGEVETALGMIAGVMTPRVLGCYDGFAVGRPHFKRIGRPAHASAKP